MKLERKDLVQFFKDGEKPCSRHTIGMEHEIFLYNAAGQRLTYPEIREILDGFIQRGWTGVFEGDNLIAAKNTHGASITLEPGGQFELSGAALPNLHKVHEEFHAYHKVLDEILETLAVSKQFLGFEPTWRRDQIPWMPKGRYEIMKKYLPTRGAKAHDMMLRTCTVQGNFDFSDEADMVRKMRVAVALQPMITALFANSSVTEGVSNGYKSYRASIWQDTDPDRCGFLDFVFDENMGYERYVDYLLTIPMFFIYRNGHYNWAAGDLFGDYMAGKIHTDFVPSLSDWADHVTVAFPEVRLKQYIEMRGADCVPPPKILALTAFWTGILYDGETLLKIEEIVLSWDVSEMKQMSLAVPKQGLDYIFEGKTLKDWSDLFIALAGQGLKKRGILNESGEAEDVYLRSINSL